MSVELKVDLAGRFCDHVKITRNTPFKLPQAIKECLDNSIDAEATEIIIDIAESKITILDDGFGMDDETLKQKALRLGGTNKMGAMQNGKNTIGRYGIGLVHTAIHYGYKKTKISSKEAIEHETRTISISFKDIEENESDSVFTCDSVYLPDVKHSFTKIELFNDKAIKNLNYSISSVKKAILNEYLMFIDCDNPLRIYVNGELMKSDRIPELKSVNEYSGEINGKLFNFKSGKYTPSSADPIRPGLHVFNNKKRVLHIRDFKKFTFNDKKLPTGLGNTLIFLDLIDGKNKWDISIHKDDVLDFYEWFYAYYDDLLRPICEEEENKSIEIKLKGISDQVLSPIINGFLFSKSKIGDIKGDFNKGGNEKGSMDHPSSGKPKKSSDFDINPNGNDLAKKKASNISGNRINIIVIDTPSEPIVYTSVDVKNNKVLIKCYINKAYLFGCDILNDTESHIPFILRSIADSFNFDFLSELGLTDSLVDDYSIGDQLLTKWLSANGKFGLI